jgi:hypothetical protein
VKSKEDDAYIDYDATKGVYWVTALGTSADNGTKLGDYSEATNTAETKYYLKNTFKIRLDDTAGNTVAPGALRVSGVNFVGADAEGKATVDDLGTSVSVLVVCGDKSQLWMQAGTDGKFTQVADSSSYLDADNTTNKFNNKVGVNVDVYVFFNGDDEDCKLKFTGYNDTYRKLLEQNDFMYNFRRAFGIVRFNFAIDKSIDRWTEDGIYKITNQEVQAIEGVTKHQVVAPILIKYDKSVDLSEIKRSYIVFEDSNKEIYVISYDKGNYINREYDALSDQRDKELLQNKMYK